jgi:hypothetical protein
VRLCKIGGVAVNHVRSKCSTCLHLLRTLAWDLRTNEQEARLANTPNAAGRPEKPVLSALAGRRAPARAPDEQVQASVVLACTCLPVGDSPRPTGLSKPTALAGHGRRRTWPQLAPRRRNRSCYVRTPRGLLGQPCLTSKCQRVQASASKCSTCLHPLAPARRAHADRLMRIKPAFPAFPPRWAHLSNPTPPPRPRPPPDASASRCRQVLHLLAPAGTCVGRGTARRRVPGPDNSRPRSWLPRQVS